MSIIDYIVWNWDIIRQVLCAVALGPMVYMIFRNEIERFVVKLNKANKEAA